MRTSSKIFSDFLSANPEKVHDKDQRLIRANDTACALGSVTQFRRDGDASATAELHPRYALIPPGNDLPGTEAEPEGAAAVPRCIELILGRPRHTDVVHLDRLTGRGFWAFTDFEVLQHQHRGRGLVGNRDLWLRHGGEDTDPGSALANAANERRHLHHDLGTVLPNVVASNPF